jgi:hypothetical protein
LICLKRHNAAQAVYRITFRGGADPLADSLPNLRQHRDVARHALEIGAILGGNDLEALWNAVNGGYVGVVP